MNINESFGYIINSTARNIKKELEDSIRKYDITTSQWAVLKVLLEENNLTQAEIAKKLSADRATTGTVIDKLISKKLIYRNQCESDKRAYKVYISEDGRQLATIISLEAVKCNTKALNGFESEEIERLITFLHRININLNREEE